MDEAYELACTASDADCVPTCIPIVDTDGDEAVAVVALKPNVLAMVALMHESPSIRARAQVAAARRAHELIADRGFVYRCQ